MKLSQAYGPDKFGLSFELFPPKTSAGEAALFRHVGVMMEFAPSFITCTYGAGGSTRDKTLNVVQEVKRRFGVAVAAHLTCVDSTAEQLRDYLKDARSRGIDNIVALRGDPPQNQSAFTPVEGGLRYANELVALIRAEQPELGIAVAGYPEMHREAPNAEVDLENLRRKVETGADVVLTQLFYHNDDFFAFRERYEKIGIQVPLVPGILPVTSLSQIQRITSLCGAKLPEKFILELAKHDDEDWQFHIGVKFAVEQVRGLIEGGIPGIHFYVLNKSKATSAVLRAVDETKARS